MLRKQERSHIKVIAAHQELVFKREIAGIYQITEYSAIIITREKLQDPP